MTRLGDVARIRFENPLVEELLRKSRKVIECIELELRIPLLDNPPEVPCECPLCHTVGRVEPAGLQWGEIKWYCSECCGTFSE
jgi:hypothetical protein